MKKIFSTKGLSLLLILTTLGFTGCKKFLDVNDNPNNPETSTPRLLLPTVEAAMGQFIGNSLQIYGGFWAQYWTQSPSASQYRALDSYNVTNTSFDRTWITIYDGALQNAQLIIDSKLGNSEHYKGIAYLLKAYTFQVATDGFGDIPSAEALSASSNLNPKYDSQSAVYDSLFTYIDKGVALLNTTNTLAENPGTQDLIFNGDITKWKAFANTLKLKAYLRLSNVNATKAQAGVAALYAANAAFLTADAKITYLATGGNENPLYNEMVGLKYTQNIGASATVIKAFKANSDPRAFQFYDRSTGVDTVAYIPQGGSNSNSGKRISPPSALVGGRASNPASALAPVKFFSLPEVYFLQAEAVARGWAAGSAATLFTNGIQASFAAANIADKAAAYIAAAPDAQLPATSGGMVKAIITQKYYAMCGTQGFEAWTEWRRTGYPDFLITSVSSILGGDKKPLRLLYPNTEAVSNANYPGTVTIDQPVWWDVN